MSEKLPRDLWVTLIGIGKILKMVALLGIGSAALFLVHRDVAHELRHWAFVLGIDPGGRLVRQALAGAGVLDDRRLQEIGAATFLYAGLFGLEGVGLLLRKGWGEWVTVFITGSFIPLEIYETARHPHVGRAVATVLNIVAVLYLLHRIRRRRRSEKTSAENQTALPGETRQGHLHKQGEADG